MHLREALQRHWQAVAEWRERRRRPVKLPRDPLSVSRLREEVIDAAAHDQSMTLLGLGADQVRSLSNDELVDRVEQVAADLITFAGHVDQMLGRHVIAEAEATTRAAARKRL